MNHSLNTDKAQLRCSAAQSAFQKHLCFICVSSVAALGIVSCGTVCSGLFHRSAVSGPGGIENPLFIPLVDRELLWNQTVDAIDDYFRIEREDRVRMIGG